MFYICLRFVINLTILCHLFSRNDDKTAADYKVTGGSVLHLVLALRGGFLFSSL